MRNIFNHLLKNKQYKDRGNKKLSILFKPTICLFVFQKINFLTMKINLSLDKMKTFCKSGTLIYKTLMNSNTILLFSFANDVEYSEERDVCFAFLLSWNGDDTIKKLLFLHWKCWVVIFFWNVNGMIYIKILIYQNRNFLYHNMNIIIFDIHFKLF